MTLPKIVGRVADVESAVWKYFVSTKVVLIYAAVIIYNIFSR